MARFAFPTTTPWPSVSAAQWNDWRWQLRAGISEQSEFATHLGLTESEQRAFAGAQSGIFAVRTTPYYLSLALGPAARLRGAADPIRKMILPTDAELLLGTQAMEDPLGEKRNSPVPRIVHRYPDRALFLVTDFCSVYCRYCTRKHFTGGEAAFPRPDEYHAALTYLQNTRSIREVILSGGDPLTLSDARLERVLQDIRAIDHIEIIRIGTRMPVVCPMRVTDDLAQMLRRHKPVFLMTHFNHPRELTTEAAIAVERFVDHGIPVMNQMVLLNGVNNHPAIVQALSRRLLYVRAKPYYMFQCDPSHGTDHLRTSVQNSLAIQKALWGRLSGLAMPTLSLDIPDGGGKTSLAPDFMTGSTVAADGTEIRNFRGWDGVEASYISPSEDQMLRPSDAEDYAEEWDELSASRHRSLR